MKRFKVLAANYKLVQFFPLSIDQDKSKVLHHHHKLMATWHCQRSEFPPFSSKCFMACWGYQLFYHEKKNSVTVCYRKPRHACFLLLVPKRPVEHKSWMNAVAWCSVKCTFTSNVCRFVGNFVHIRFLESCCINIIFLSF